MSDNQEKKAVEGSDNPPAPDNESDWESIAQNEEDIVEVEDEELQKFEDEVFDGPEEEEKETKTKEVTQISETMVFKYMHHADSVYTLSLNPTTKNQFVSGGGDDIALIWEFQQEAPKKILKGHTDTIQRVAYNFDGALIASGAMDATIKIWDGKTGELKQTLEGPAAEIECMDWHPKGNAIIGGSNDGTAWMWNANTGEYMTIFSGHEKAVTACSFSNDGKKVISASEDMTLRVWNPRSGECIEKVKGYGFHEDVITCLKVHPEQNICLTGSIDRTACVSSYEHGTKLGRTGVHDDSIEDVIFVTKFDIFATGCLDGKTRVYDLSKFLLRETVHFDAGITKLAYNYAHKSFVASGNDGTFGLFDHRQSSPIVHYLDAHTACINDFILVDENILLTASDDKQILQWDLRKLTKPQETNEKNL